MVVAPHDPVNVCPIEHAWAEASMACSAFSGGHAVLAMVLSAEGGCQCGAVCYKVTAAPVVVYACHCTVCQTQSGSAFGLAARFNSDDVELVKGSLASFERPGSGGFFFTNSFCGQCGTRIHHVSSRFPHLASLKPGTLDDTSWLKPTFHIFMRSAQSWFEAPEDMPSFDTMPPDLSVFSGGYQGD